MINSSSTILGFFRRSCCVACLSGLIRCLGYVVGVADRPVIIGFVTTTTDRSLDCFDSAGALLTNESEDAATRDSSARKIQIILLLSIRASHLDHTLTGQ